MSFPVVFQGWPTTPGENIAGTPAVYQFNPGALPNELFEIEAKAPQQPVLGETWAIEALLLDFLVEYELTSVVNTKAELEAINAKITALEARLTTLKTQLKAAENAEAQARAIWVKEGSPTPSTLAKEVEETVAQIQAVKGEIEDVNIEITEQKTAAAVAGRPETLAGLDPNPVFTRIKMNGPRDTSILEGLQSFDRRTTRVGVFGEGPNYGAQTNTIQEHYSQRIDLSNPPQALGGDQLALSLTAYVPAPPVLPASGILLEYIKIAVIDAHLQCSVAGSLART